MTMTDPIFHRESGGRRRVRMSSMAGMAAGMPRSAGGVTSRPMAASMASCDGLKGIPPIGEPDGWGMRAVSASGEIASGQARLPSVGLSSSTSGRADRRQLGSRHGLNFATSRRGQGVSRNNRDIHTFLLRFMYAPNTRRKNFGIYSDVQKYK